MHDRVEPEKQHSHEVENAALTGGTTRAALTSGTAQLFARILTVVLSIATARALEPREVGLLGLAVIVVGVISMVGYYPETAAIVGRSTTDDSKYGIASAGIRAIVTLLAFGVVAVSFPLAGHYLTAREDGTQAVAALIAVLACGPVVELVGSYPRVILQRRLDLKTVALAALLQPVVFVGLAVYLLWAGYGYFGVAWANVVGTITVTLLLWVRLYSKRWAEWKGWPSVEIWRETTGGAARVFTGGFGGFLGERLDNILVASALGPTAMSYYGMAWNGARTPANIFGSTIGFVLIPTISRMQDEPNRVRRAVSESLKHTYLLLAPVCAMLFVSAPLVVTYVLGSKWLPLVPCLRIMCFTVMAIPILHACNALLVAAGKAHLTGISTGVHLVALLVTIPIFSRQWQVVGAAVGDLVSTAILMGAICTTAYLATRQIEPRMFLSVIVPVAAAFLAGLVAYQLGALGLANAPRLVSEITLVGVGYVLFILVLGGKNNLYDLVGVLRSATRRAVIA